MKLELHLKIISIILAFSLLYLALYNQQPILAESIRIIISLVIILYFIVIWMRTKKFLYFITSMLLPIWLLILIHPNSFADHFFLWEKENILQEIIQVVQSDNKYKKLTTYVISNGNAPILSKQSYNHSLLTKIASTKEIHPISSNELEKLLRQSYIIGFEMRHNSILFHIKNNRQVRYYLNEESFVYPKDKKIKTQWYRVN